jgi:hypothetical protein
LIFEYSDGSAPEDKKSLGDSELYISLSTGEQRVFYLLNIIFQIEARRRKSTIQLVIVDDIADSFDYKNKYAIIEYLKDVLEENNFRLIILTHNFDFYKTVKGRFGGKMNYQGNWTAIKKVDGIELTVGEKKNVFDSLRSDLHTCNIIFVACIPFVRNLIEYSIGKENDSYYTLTSLLHMKSENIEKGICSTKNLEVQQVFDVFNTVFGKSNTTTTPNKKVYELIIEKSEEIISKPADYSLNIKNKLCLSLAIRLIAEEYMISKITDLIFHEHIQTKQTGKITSEFKKEHPSATKEIAVLERVNLMTAENIHINSFMYEPLMDLTEDHLRRLFVDIKKLS